MFSIRGVVLKRKWMDELLCYCRKMPWNIYRE